MSNKRPRQDSNPIPSQHHNNTASPQSSEAVYTHSGKYTHLDDESTKMSKNNYIIHCTLPPHDPLAFTGYEDYEIHYQKSHLNRCIECKRNFPTDHFLNLHIAENHDPLNAGKRERGDKTYQCFVEGCGKICRTWQKRRMHLVAAHMFPRNYDFLVVNDGLDNRKSMLRPERSYRRRSSAASGAMQIKEETSNGTDSSAQTTLSPRGQASENEQSDSRNHQKDTAMDDIANSMAALKFVPKSVPFGRRQGGGLARK